MQETARIFVGCDPNDCDLEQMMMLEYSLRHHASMPVEIHWMQLSRDPASPWYADPEKGLGWRTDTWVTPFSGFRWAIPEICGFEGRAIYMDADMLVLGDIAALWRQPLAPGKTMMAKKGRKNRTRFCVTVWDCAAAKAHLPALDALKASPQAHAERIQYFRDHAALIQSLPHGYNNVDGEDRPAEDIRILHYSDIGTQFSHPHTFRRLAAEGVQHWFDGEVLDHPRRDLQALFDRYYAQALAAGYTLDAYRVAAPFGAMRKASQTHYTGNRRTRRVSLWSKLKLRARMMSHAMMRSTKGSAATASAAAPSAPSGAGNGASPAQPQSPK